MKYTKLLRIWHWLNAIAILGLLGTFLLRKTFLSWRTNSEVIVQKLAEYDIDVTTAAAKVVAKTIRAPMWEWHIIFGYALAALILFRLFIFLKQGISYKDTSSLYKLGLTILYSIFYLLVTFMALSGITLHLGADLGISKGFIGDLKEIHETVAWFFVFYVPIHISGAVIAELGSQKGLISKMISGADEQKTTA